MNSKSRFLASAKIWIQILKVITFVFDMVTLPLYGLLHRPWRRLKKHAAPKAKLIEKSNGRVTYKADLQPTKLHADVLGHDVDAIDKMYAYAFKRYSSRRCMGYRKVLHEREIVGDDGKRFWKLDLGNYIWLTYQQVESRVQAFSKGIRALGIKPRERVCIFAETRMEWAIAAIAAFYNNLTVVTLYATLGDEGIFYGLSETGCSLVITTKKLLPKVENNLKALPTIKHIIYMEDQGKEKERSEQLDCGVGKHSFLYVETTGQWLPDEPCPSPATPDDLAFIMYTSGTTNTPKGVMLSHKNFVQGCLGLHDGIHGSDLRKRDVYIGYLPLAHIFELTVEGYMLLSGIPIGYASTLTMFENGPMLKPGCKGDFAVLRPTVTMMVPLMLDRIYKAILNQVSKASALEQAVFLHFYDYKKKWFYRGFKTPLTDAIIFSRIRKVYGGRLRFIGTASAPLSPDVHEFIRHVMSLILVQGYGLTETTANSTWSTKEDLSVGRSGKPLITCDIRLEDWAEGGYSVDDKPNPRGEVVIGGPSIASGYFKLPDITAEAFYKDETGKQWFRSGDIGEMDPDGVIKIIDRKKDLLKLQTGEYISLARIEAKLRTSPFVETICVYAESKRSSCIALVIPAATQILAQAKKLQKENLDYKEACKDKDVQEDVLHELQALGRQNGLSKYEIPVAIKLCSDLWTPESGLVTAALKLRRRQIQEFYQDDIDDMYDGTEKDDL